MLKFQMVTGFSVALFVSAQLALGHGEDADLAPRVEGGKIVVDAYSDGTGVISEFDERVFAYEVGEVVANYVGDPGYNLRPTNSPAGYAGHGFADGSQIGTRFVDQLLYWDGTGAVNFAAATTQLVTFSFGPNEVTLDGTGVTSAADTLYFLNSTGPASNPHDHLGALFAGSDLAGIFIVASETVTTMSGVAASDPIYFVFNNGGEALETAHGEAIEWAEVALVPEPASLGLLAIGGVLMLRRRRA